MFFLGGDMGDPQKQENLLMFPSVFGKQVKKDIWRLYLIFAGCLSCMKGRAIFIGFQSFPKAPPSFLFGRFMGSLSNWDSSQKGVFPESLGPPKPICPGEPTSLSSSTMWTSDYSDGPKSRLQGEPPLRSAVVSGLS